jgi:adenylate cyclase
VFLTQIIKSIWESLEDKQNFKNVLGAHLSPQVMSLTSENIHKINLGGQKYNIAVLFTDLRGFTKYSEKVDPSEVGITLNTVLGFQADMIMDSDGVVDKFIGDSVMGFWGAPVTDKDYAIKALEVTAKISMQFKKWKDSGDYPFEIGLALHEGSAVVGNFGSKKRFNYTSIGDTVNTASRLEALTKFYGSNVLLTSTLWKSLSKQQQQNYKVNLIDIIRPRGKQKKIAIYELQSYYDGSRWQEIQTFEQEYAQIFESYQQKKFRKVIKLCRQCKSKKAKIIMERCRKLLQTKTTQWDGVWVFE